MPKIIRSSEVSLKFTNHGKLGNLSAFMAEYRNVVQSIVDHVWENGVAVGSRVFSIKEESPNVPSFLPLSAVPVMNTTLSARAVKCASTQAMSMISAAVTRRRKDLFCRNKCLQAGTSTPKAVQDRLSKNLVRPCATRVKAELNSICAKVSWDSGTSFDGWLKLSSLGKVYGVINIPIKKHRHINSLIKTGTQLNSVLINKNTVGLRFEMRPTENNGTEVVGADSGMKTVLTLSNGDATVEKDKHGHSLESICESISRKKRGSKACKAKREHRKNFINHALNKINFNGISEIRLEKIHNINNGRRTSRKLTAWTSTLIRDKVKSLAEIKNVSFVQQGSAYRSQRCSKCGNVRKANRKGKVYSCRRCGLSIDADLNAARNHEQNLNPVPAAFFRTKVNLGDGFLWLPAGVFNLSGAELTVPLS